jgi:hypothetical protein
MSGYRSWSMGALVWNRKRPSRVTIRKLAVGDWDLGKDDKGNMDQEGSYAGIISVGTRGHK